MADAVQRSLVPGLAGAGEHAPRRSSLQRFMRRRSTLAFEKCLPHILIIVGLVAYPAL
jgi:hypothetical protein